MIKTRIIVSSSIKESEKLKSLASFGEHSLGTRYMSTLDVARYLLQLSGITLEHDFIQNDDLAAEIYWDAKSTYYINKLSYNDLLGAINTIADLRRHIVTDEEKTIISKMPKDQFKEKNEGVKQLYRTIVYTLHGLEPCVDEVETIRFAYEHISSFPNIEFVVVDGDKINDYELDMALLNKASGNNVKKLSFDNPVHISSYTKAFSQVNEVENILSYIYKHNIPFDQCIIAGADTTDYANVLTNYSDLLGFPLVIGTGMLVTNTNPGKLFSLLDEYKKNHYHVDYLKKLIYDESFNIEQFKEDLHIDENVSFDDVITTCGQLRLGFEEDVEIDDLEEEPKYDEVNDEKIIRYEDLLNKYLSNGINKEDTRRRMDQLEYVKTIKDIFNNGMYKFVERYARVSDDVDKNALGKDLKGLDYFESNRVYYRDVAKVVLKQKVGRKSPEPGKLYFTSISNASSVLRKHLFVVGLSSNNYPGTSKEDPVLLDRDYAAFAVENASNREITYNRNSYLSLIKEASKYGVDIHLSYAYYNSISLKEQNASSVVFETYKFEYGQDKTIKDLEDDFASNKDGKFFSIEYFSTDLLPISHIARALIDHRKIAYDNASASDNSDTKLNDDILNKPLSASAIMLYKDCPYQFFLSRVLGIPQPQEIDLFQIIPANEYGDIAHRLMKDLDKKVTSEKEFLNKCKEVFDEYFVFHHTDNIPLKEKNKEEFLEMMANAYEMEELDLPYIKEKDIYTIHQPSGLKIHGLPDKVIKTSSGLYAIDYKTGRSKTHNLADPESLLQCVIYSYIIEKEKKLPVSGFEYRYLRYKDKVSSASGDMNMADYYQVLDYVLNQIKQSYETGEFIPNIDHCKKCFFSGVCTRKKQ